MWDLVGNPEDRFSQNEAQLIIDKMVASGTKHFDLIFASLYPSVISENYSAGGI